MATSFRPWSLETLFVGRLALFSQASGSDSATTLEVGIGSSLSIQHGGTKDKDVKGIFLGVSITKCSNRSWVYFSHSHSSSTFISFFWIAPVFFSLCSRGPTRKNTRILRHLGARWLVFPEWLGTGCRGSVWYTMAPVPWICHVCISNDIHSHNSRGFCVRSMWLSRKLARLTYRSHGLMKTPGRFKADFVELQPCFSQCRLGASEM